VTFDEPQYFCEQSFYQQSCRWLIELLRILLQQQLYRQIQSALRIAVMEVRSFERKLELAIRN
jgi:hypothetical protein